MEKIKEARNIIIFTGAGVSTASGIPDYRSDSGIYQNFSSPDAYLPKMREAVPGTVHYFCKRLYDQGKLRRIYTQNIDRLHSRVFDDPKTAEEIVVEFHGSIETGTVNFGEEIPDKVKAMVKLDLIDHVDEIDLIIVMGTTMSVLPFAALPNMVRKSCVRIFVNNDLTVIPPIVRKRHKERTDLYQNSIQTSFISICGQKVTTKPTWIDHSRIKPGIRLTKWKEQYLYEADCNEWCLAVF